MTKGRMLRYWQKDNLNDTAWFSPALSSSDVAAAGWKASDTSCQSKLLTITESGDFLRVNIFRNLSYSKSFNFSVERRLL